MSQAYAITDWTIQSTNMDKNVLHDVTRGDLVDIIDRLYRDADIDTITQLYDLIFAHTAGYGVVDPHETTTAVMEHGVIDSVYAYWLKRGYTGTMGDFKDTLYRYCQRANKYMLFTGLSDSSVTTVRVVDDYIQSFHDRKVNEYGSSAIFAFSEKAARWSGLLSGLQIRSSEDSGFAEELLAIYDPDGTLLDFVGIYDRALDGDTTLQETEDDYQFVETYDRAWNLQADETYSEDYYKWVNTYLIELGEFTFDIALDDILSAFGAGPYTDLVSEYHSGLADGLYGLPVDTSLPEATELDEEAYGTYAFTDQYQEYLGDALSGLPSSSGTVSYGEEIGLDDSAASGILSLYTDSTYGFRDAYYRYYASLVSTETQATELLGETIDEDLAALYDTALSTGLNGLPGWSGLLPDRAELADIDTDVNSLVDVYMHYLDDNYLNLPGGYTPVFDAEYTLDDDIVDVYMQALGDEFTTAYAYLFESTGTSGVVGQETTQDVQEIIADTLANEDPWSTKALVSRSDDVLTIAPNSNGDVWYQWRVSVPKRLVGSTIDISVTASRHGVLEYRVANFTKAWTTFSGKLDVDSSSMVTSADDPPLTSDFSDIHDYRYLLPLDIENTLVNRTPEEINSIEYDFRVSFGSNSNVTVISDIVTVIDARKVLTDDPLVGTEEIVADEILELDDRANNDIGFVEIYNNALNGTSIASYTEDPEHFVDLYNSSLTGSLNDLMTVYTDSLEDALEGLPGYDGILPSASAVSGLDIETTTLTDVYFTYLDSGMASLPSDISPEYVDDYSTTDELLSVYLHAYDGTALSHQSVTAAERESELATIEATYAVSDLDDDSLDYFDFENIEEEDTTHQTELYADIPHQAIWESFFVSRETPTPTFAWYSAISSAYAGADVDWYTAERGSVLCTVQLYPDILAESDITFHTSVRQSLFRVESASSLLEVYSIITGSFTESTPADTSTMTDLESIQIGIYLRYSGRELNALSDDISGSYEHMCRLCLTYDGVQGSLHVYYPTPDTSMPDSEMDPSIYDERVNQLLDILDMDTTIDLVARYDTALDDGLLGLPGWYGVLPSSNELSGIDRDAVSIVDVYLQYLDGAYTGLPGGHTPTFSDSVYSINDDLLTVYTDAQTSTTSVDPISGEVTGTQRWTIALPADIQTHLGVYEVVCYPTILDEETVRNLIYA